MTRTLAFLTLLLASTQLAAAQVTEWTGTRTLGTDYTVTDGTDVVILANGTFKFQSVDSGSLADITSITIANSVTGTVTLHIVRNPADMAGTNGAVNVDLLNLTNTHATPVIGNLAELHITGELGHDGPRRLGQRRDGRGRLDGTNGNNATDRVWNVGPCRGDLNGDRSVNSADNATVDGGDSGCNPATLFCVALNSPTQYRALFPGLEGSRIWHGNCNFTDGFTSADSTAFGQLTSGECCIVTRRPGDVDVDFDVDITDLAILLSNFGNTSDPQWGNGDMDGNGSVNLNDLALLLSRFGTDYCPNDEPEPLTGGVTISVTGFNTGGVTGGGFAGESKHFVLDVLVEIDDTDDDWIGGGVIATTANSASFRIVPDADNPPVPTSSTPDKYATFFSQPYANVDGSNRFNSPFTTGGIAGGYSPTGSGYTYSASAIDAAWYDTNTASNDGPAAVLRLVVNVENVSGADTSGGFGSVYFTTGTPGSGDIKVADMTFEVEHKYDDSGSTTVTGSFYVTD